MQTYIRYETNADGDRSHSTTRKRDALGVHRQWYRLGRNPHTYGIREDDQGRPVIDRIA